MQLTTKILRYCCVVFLPLYVSWWWSQRDLGFGGAFQFMSRTVGMSSVWPHPL